MKIALDTNILAYIAGFERSSSDSAKVERARVTVEQLVRYNELIVVTQVLGELYNLLTKGGIARREARDIVGLAESKYLIVAGTRSCFQDAFDLATDHKLGPEQGRIIATALLKYAYKNGKVDARDYLEQYNLVRSGDEMLVEVVNEADEQGVDSEL